MTHTTPPFGRRTIVLGTFCAAMAGAPALAQQPQLLFSVDYHGPTKSRPDSGAAVPITEGDILRRAPGAGPFGVTTAPFTNFTAGQIGITLYPTCAGGTTGQSCGVEVDALSFGNEDRYPGPIPGQPRPRLYFSVDRFAQGVANSIGSPSLRSEASARDASSDVYTHVLDLVPLSPPIGVVPSNQLVVDGDGESSSSGGLAPGLGLFEPHSPQPAPSVDIGDNLDALSMSPVPTGPMAAVYYSLDGAFPDPNGIPHTNSAQLNGFSPAAVLRKQILTGSPTVYASPAQLGLSAFNDDLDALALWDNGDGIFQPSQTPYDWVGPLTGGTDMLLFSVRRGSQIVGQTDSLLGEQIEPGDILTTPVAGGNGRPAIFIAAEAMGLSTQRTGAGPRDELDAIALEIDPYFDCNGNGVEDSVDIGQGASNDSNNNGIPDECEQTYGRYCTCTVGLGPCGNDSAMTGCLNSTGVGATLDGLGTTSVTTDDLQFVAASMPGSTSTLLFAGPNQANTAFGDGRRCVASPVYRLGIHTASGGTTTYGPGIRNTLCTSFSQCMSAGSTFNFQVWYRNAASYCTSATFNLTNGLAVTYTP